MVLATTRAATSRIEAPAATTWPASSALQPPARVGRDKYVPLLLFFLKFACYLLYLG
jgi:hypothetical protein